MSGICDKCRRKPCPAEGEGLRVCDFYEGGETRYERMFGTPERAARTMFGIVYSEAQGCDDDCPLSEFCDAHVDEEPPDDGGEAVLLEWLRGDAE